MSFTYYKLQTVTNVGSEHQAAMVAGMRTKVLHSKRRECDSKQSLTEGTVSIL